MPKVFLSYRRSDSQMVAGRLREWLLQHLGRGTVFRDKDSIGAGADWTRAIHDGLRGDTIVLALIGRGWAGARDDSGQRRLDDPKDWNRQELEIALDQGRRIIPLLIDGAPMPAEADLPPSLQPLIRHNALNLRDDDWESDCRRLAQALGLHPGSTRRAWLGAAAAAASVAIGCTWWWLTQRNEGEAQDPDTVLKKPMSREQIVQKLSSDQYQALNLFASDPARAKHLVDDNFAEVDEALKAFPNDLELHALAGYAAKNVYASSKGVLTAEARGDYLKRAQTSFEHVLALDPNDPSATNGMGNVRFYQGRFDEAIALHRHAIQLTQDRYPAATQDLAVVQRVQSGALKFDP
jgi:TIR domain